MYLVTVCECHIELKGYTYSLTDGHSYQAMGQTDCIRIGVDVT